ncbi:hypothetical protein ACFSGI_14070 [Paenibacillus nicotianae]|uniref:Uncharacterized protein n=1 Tax=Paenibacillus nicotianae TaxID=1526551 RepID=A0ABW4UUI3_9BACL
MDQLTVQDIPWKRITTPYGRATEVPQMLAKRNYSGIADIVEHQSTLWQVTPWALFFLLKELPLQSPDEVSAVEIDLYATIIEALSVHEELEDTEQTLIDMPLLLEEQYLWDENSEEDELEWENEQPRGYDSETFFYYYVYSYLLLKQALPAFEHISRHTKDQDMQQVLQECMEYLE